MSTNLIAIGRRRPLWRPAALRSALVTTAAGLSAYGSAIWIEHRADLHVDIVITAVGVTMTLARVQLGAGPWDRLIGAVVLAVSAAGASEVSSLIQRHQIIGDAAFILAVAGSIWVRRFGPSATKAGTVLVVPFVTLLVTQAQGAPPHAASYDLWSALIAVVAAFWVAAFQLAAGALGWREQRQCPVTATPQATRQAIPKVLPRATRQATPQPPASPAARRIPASTTRSPPSTRMAAQMAVAVGGAFIVGHRAFHEHWPWAVLTAFIVCSGSRGRGDVLHKGVLRAAGAAAGTVVATWIADAFPPDDRWSVVVIFAVLGVAGWLREISYAWWAGSVTAVLSLLYGYFGQSAPSLLQTRLEAILVGAALGVAASWFVLPVRTGDVMKRRVADALAALGEFLSAPIGDRDEAQKRRTGFLKAIVLLEQIAKPVRAQRMLMLSADHANAIDALHSCVEPIGTLAMVFADAEKEPAWEPLRRAVAANVGAVRRALGRKPGPAYKAATADIRTTASAALSDLDAALARLATIYGPPPSQPSESQVSIAAKDDSAEVCQDPGVSGPRSSTR